MWGLTLESQPHLADGWTLSDSGVCPHILQSIWSEEYGDRLPNSLQMDRILNERLRIRIQSPHSSEFV